ncbi:MAG: CAP domain-containing protein [Phycisphaeraceae bacterium]
MISSRRLSVLAGFLAVGLALIPPQHAGAQDQREIDIIAQIGQETIAQRRAEAAAAEEAAHQARLEEQSRLRAVYQQYLGDARRAAQKAINIKRKAASSDQVDALRRQARVVIDEVDDATKQRVRNELDPLFEKLEAAISLTPDELLESDAELAALRKRVAPGAGNDIDWVDKAAILYALCPDDNAAKVIAANIPLREKLSADEAQAIDECNYRRLLLGLNPLAIDMKLVECSRDHSKDMVTLGFFAHNSPVEGKETPWKRAENFGTKASGENIAAGYNNGNAVTMGWWYSPGHLKNMMGRGHNRIGVGQEKQHYTQMFGR